MFLRQHTATTVQMGPYLNFPDGNTELATLTLTASSAFFSKLGGVFAVGTSTATMGGSGANGMFTLNLASANVDTVGRFEIYQHATAALYVKKEFTVLSQQVYDSLISATDLLDVNVRQYGEATVGTATGTTGFPKVDVWGWTGQTLTTATGSVPTVDAILVSHGTPQTATDAAQAVRDQTLVTGTATSLGNAISEINRLVELNLDAKISGIAITLTATDIFTQSDLAITGQLGAISSNVWSYAGQDITSVPTATAFMSSKVDFMYGLAIGQRTADRNTNQERLINLGGTATIAAANFSDSGGIFTRFRWGTAT